MQSEAQSDARIETRSNLFVMATVYAAAISMPVRIRNLSCSGALFEAASPPPVGAAITLSRGSLGIDGKIVWIDGNKAGAQFSSTIRVADWLPAGVRGSRQQLIDELVHQARLGARQTDAIQSPSATGATAALCDELTLLQRGLEQAGAQLAGDEHVLNRHTLPLQAIDGAVQSLARLAGQAPTSTLRRRRAP